MEEITAETRVVVDGDLSPTKLIKLIQLAAEEERLDYKLGYDLTGGRATKDKAEVARDIIAMANTHGGYIVLGVREGKGDESKYIPEGLSDVILNSLDIDILRAQVEKYVTERLNIQLQIHRLTDFGSKSFALIYIPPSKHSPIVAQVSGNYSDPLRNETKAVFQAGDVLVRKGGSSARADQADMRRIISLMRQREKEIWTEEVLGVRELVQRLDRLISILSAEHTSPSSTAEGTPPYDPSVLFLAPNVFHEHVLQLLEQHREVALRRYMQEIAENIFPVVGEEFASDGDNAVLEFLDNRVLPMLNNLTVIAIMAIQHRAWDLFRDAQRIFYDICERAARTKFIVPQDRSIHFDQTRIWREVIARIYFLGGLLVKLEDYGHTSALIRQYAYWDTYEKGLFWSRHILTELSRAHRLEEKSLVRLGVKFIQEYTWFGKLFMDDIDQAIAAMCQFDYLQCIHGLADSQSVYPSFGIYNNSRTEPIVVKLIAPGPVRESIPNMSDADLAEHISGLDRFAGREYFMYNGWESNEWHDKRIVKLLASHVLDKGSGEEEYG